jgi:GNAT superfamily N-acetyltransferase
MMIRLRWTDYLTAEDVERVTDLIDFAAAYDREAEFSTVSTPTAAEQAADAGPVRVHHLLVTDDVGELQEVDFGPRALVAYLRVLVADRAGSVEYVVHPDSRSRGITTLLMERLRGDGPQSWRRIDAAVLTVVAQGDHPAAQRAALRFGAAETERTWVLVRPLGEDAPPLATAWSAEARIDRGSAEASGRFRVHGAGGVSVDVELVPHPDGLTGRIHGDPLPPPEEMQSLLACALEEVSDRGAARATLTIPAEDPRVLVARHLYFEHERSDVSYRLWLSGTSGVLS